MRTLRVTGRQPFSRSCAYTDAPAARAAIGPHHNASHFAARQWWRQSKRLERVTLPLVYDEYRGCCEVRVARIIGGRIEHVRLD